ncbi:MAG: hypothetical protein J6C98_07115 [Oscillospiraceae bacterium]|nr:hypothetical protein [Oscillospiraceae bacterium]
MEKERKDFNIALPLSVNADHQMVEVFHGDPLGSYTGRCEDPLEKPVQDADDL